MWLAVDERGYGGDNNDSLVFLIYPMQDKTAEILILCSSPTVCRVSFQFAVFLDLFSIYLHFVRVYLFDR